MITFVHDVRMDPAVVEKVQQTLDRLMANGTVQELLTGVNMKIMFTNLKPDGQINTKGTGTGTQEMLLDVVHGLGHDYNYSGVEATGQTGYDQILLIDARALNEEIEVQDYSGGKFNMSFTRVLFHELMHTRFDWPLGANLTAFSDELVIFTENIFYRQVADELGESDTSVRYGHGHQAYNGQGVSGLASFQAYLDSPTANVEIDADGTDESKATFVAEDGVYRLSKTYFSSGHEIGEYSFDHYTRITETKAVGSYITTTISGLSVDPRFWTVTSDMMGGNLSAALADAVNAVSSLADFTSSFTVAYNRISGLANDGFTDRDIRYAGPSSHGSTNPETPAWVGVDDTEAPASYSTVLIGPGGRHGDILDAGSGNDLVIAAGSVQNILHGNGGDDILVGTDANDKLYGGVGNNILIGRGGQNHLVGGSDNTIAYYGDRPQGIIVYDGLGRVEHDGVLDTIVDIKGFVGTKRNDVFVADGKGHTFYGNGGTDEFLTASGGDTFRGVNGVISGTISFAALLTSGIEIGETGTNVGHVYDRPNLIIGSSQVDVIKLSSSSRIAVRAGGGDDDITVSKGNAYGEGGNDTFRVVAGIVGSIIDGGDDEDTIFFESSYVPDAYVSINWEDDTPGYAYKTANGFMGGATLVSIEKFDFSKDGVAIKTHLRANTNNEITGTDRGNDEIIGGHLIDIIHAGGSSKSLSAGYHNILNGRDGDDELYGATNGVPSLQGDWLIGGAGNDTIYGSAGKDRIDGGYGSTDDDELHGGAGDDLFFDASGTNRIWGDDGVDTLNLASYSRSQLTFGTTDGWHVVAAKDGSFTTYLYSVERIVTRNGTVSAEGVRIARAASDPDDQHVLDDTGFDFSGFDTTPKPDPEFVEVEVSSTGEGPFYLISEQDVLDFGSYPSAQADDTLIFYPDTPNGNAAAAAEAMPFDSYAGSFNQTSYQHEIDQMSLYGVYTQAPIHHDMLII